jgi:hypothetical protein
MANAAKKSGHKSKSKNFRTVVSLALLNNPKRFKRVESGDVYGAVSERDSGTAVGTSD